MARETLLNKKAALKGEKATSEKAPLQGLMRKRAKLSGESTNEGARSAGRLEGTRNKLLGVSPKKKSARNAQNVFAGETEAQALAREDRGLKGVRPNQVSVSEGGFQGSVSVGISSGGTSKRGTRGGLAIN